MTQAEVIQQRVLAGFQRSAVRAGTGQFNVILIQAEIHETTYPMPTPSQSAYEFTAVQTKLDMRDYQSGNVQNGDIKLLLATGPTEPSGDDKVIADGLIYSIISVDRVAPAGVPLLWKVIARGGTPDDRTIEEFPMPLTKRDYVVYDGMSGTASNDLGIEVNFVDAAGAPIDIAGAPVEFRAELPDNNNVTINAGSGLTYDDLTGKIIVPFQISTFSALLENTSATYAIAYEPDVSTRLPILLGKITKRSSPFG